MKYNANTPTEKKSPALALLWLLMIPIQGILSIAITTLGAKMESSMYANRPDDAVGHPVPFLTVLFAALAVFLMVIAIVVSIILTIVRMIVISRRNKRIDQMNAGYGPDDQPSMNPETYDGDRAQVYYAPPE